MFRIGEFAKFSRVSVKMLRHYDEINLFTPAWIDPATQYRYYTAEQLLQLNRIVALKDLGFSLEQIDQLLVDDFSTEQFRGLLKLRRLELEKVLEATAVQLLQVKNRLAQLDRPLVTASDVVLRQIASESYAAIRQVVDHDSDQISQLFDEVEQHVASFNARAARPPLLIYHGDGEVEPLDVEILVPISKRIIENGRVYALTTSPVNKMACLVHSGSYATLPETYSVLAQWIVDNNYHIDGPTRELYLRFNGSQDGYHLPPAFLAESADQFVTELQIPISK